MLWLAVKCGVDRKQIMFVACQCARLVLSHLPKNEKRPLIAIETAERWIKGEATIEEVSNAGDAAHTAAYTAAYTAAEAAAFAAAEAAEAAAYTAYMVKTAYEFEAAVFAMVKAISHSAAFAAVEAIFAADTIVAARKKTNKQCADIVRKYVKYKDIANGIKEKL